MGTDNGTFGRIRDKAKGLVDGALGGDGSVGDEAPDIEYEETPKQHILHDGMVVLSEEQVGQVERGAGAARSNPTDDGTTG